jgi:glycolate oxidase FAD binding subunit
MSSAPAATSIAEFRAAVSFAAPFNAASDVSATVDGMTPRVIARPTNEAEVAETLVQARKRGLTAIAVGGGTHLHIGNVPSAYDVALSTTGLTGTIEHEPDDLTVTVDAGVPIEALGAVLAKHGQWLPLDPPMRAESTVGGLIATNGFGPLRHALGTVRDWVIGLRVAHVDGTVSKSGGRVVKNVAGYDMHKLHVGALGSLGVITQATFKLASLPQTEVLLSVAFRDASAACAFVLSAHDARAALLAAEVASPEPGGAQWRALLRVGGSRSAVERTRRDLGELAARFGASLEEHDTGGDHVAPQLDNGDARLILRMSVPPTRVAEAINGLGERHDARVSATVSAGVIRIEAAVDVRAVYDAAQRTAARQGGSTFVESTPLEFKREIDVFGAQRGDFAIMKRLKDEFDPQRTLSPGRFIGKL